jgi:hypothetical protein
MKAGDCVVSKTGQRGTVVCAFLVFGVPWVVVDQENGVGYSGQADWWMTLQEAYS